MTHNQLRSASDLAATEVRVPGGAATPSLYRAGASQLKGQTHLSVLRTYLVAQMVKRLPTMPETRAQSPGWEDLLEREMATHSSVLA